MNAPRPMHTVYRIGRVDGRHIVACSCPIGMSHPPVMIIMIMRAGEEPES